MCIAIWIETLEYLPYTSSRAAIPNLFDTRKSILWKTVFYTDWRGGGFEMIQAHYMYCALYFYYYDISCISDHQALDPEGCGPLQERTQVWHICVYTYISESLQISIKFHLEHLLGNLLKRLPDI